MTEPEFNDGTVSMPVEDDNPGDQVTDEVAEFTAGVQSQDPTYQPDPLEDREDLNEG